LLAFTCPVFAVLFGLRPRRIESLTNEI